MNVRKKISYKEVNMRKAMRNIYVLLLSLFFFVVLCSTEKTVFRFARHYANHMVLQRAPYVPVLWGFGEENTPVIVSVAGKEYRSTVKTGKHVIATLHNTSLVLFNVLKGEGCSMKLLIGCILIQNENNSH